jgi:hypothetical protein
MRSSDGGRTWTQDRVADASNISWGPTAVASSSDGTLAVLYLDAVEGGGRYDVMLATAPAFGAKWSALKLAGPMDSGSLSYTPWDGPVGPYHDLVATPDGFLAAFTALRPYPLRDGDADALAAMVVRGDDRPRARLRVRVRPRRVRAGRRATFRVTVDVTSGRGVRPVRGAAVRFAGTARRTGRRGGAKIHKRFRSPGRRSVTATKRGYRRGRTWVRVVR